MRSIVVIPTYNERENLDNIINQVLFHAPDLHILVVDDNSPDGTGALAEELSARHPGRLFVLHRVAKAGLGTAYTAGFRYALANGYEAILQMDADLSHDPAYLPQFLKAIEHNDLVLGSRYVRGINVVNWDFKRLLLSKAASLYVRLITRMPVSDATGGFKCWRRSMLEKVGLDRVFSNGYLFQVEMTFKAWKRGARISELSIIFYERNLGRSKMDWPIIWEAVWGVLKLKLLPEKWLSPKRVAVALRSGEQTAV